MSIQLYGPPLIDRQHIGTPWGMMVPYILVNLSAGCSYAMQAQARLYSTSAAGEGHRFEDRSAAMPLIHVHSVLRVVEAESVAIQTEGRVGMVEMAM